LWWIAGFISNAGFILSSKNWRRIAVFISNAGFIPSGKNCIKKCFPKSLILIYLLLLLRLSFPARIVVAWV
jgi:hypothetical protein